MTPLQALLAGSVALVALLAGVVIVFGVGWGLIVGGVLALAGSVLLYDPKAGKRQLERGKP